MFALRGISTAHAFVEEAFTAFESSSEETHMGMTWQKILKDLSQPAVIDAGDILAERESALWVVEVKSQTNTLNSSSLAQTLRTLKNRVEYHSSFQQARRQPVRAMIGVMRGRERDQQVVYSAARTRTENRDLDGFSYRYLVGPAFWRWLTGRPNILSLIGDFSAEAASLQRARQDCLARLHEDMDALLTSRSLPDTIEALLTLTFEEDTAAPGT